MSAVDTKVAELVERNMTAVRLEQTAPAYTPITIHPPTRCPVHTECVLEGGPIQYRCEYGYHTVRAADINREVSL